jgi:hypothetical protein
LLAAAAAATATLALLAGCGTTGNPPPLSEASLVEAQTFPYFRIYWVGPSFEGNPLAAVDGTKSYSTTIGDSVYYGDCVNNKGLLGGGAGCRLPLQVTTVIYRRHSNAPLGPQTNTLIRGVPGVIYDEGRSIELYSGRTSIDIFSARATGALRAAWALRTLNAPGSSTADLPPPVFCPGLWGQASFRLQEVLHQLPGAPCQKAAQVFAESEHLTEKPNTHVAPLGSAKPRRPAKRHRATRRARARHHRRPGRPARRSPRAGLGTPPSRSGRAPTARSRGR